MKLCLDSLNKAASRWGALLGIIATVACSLVLYFVDNQANPPYYVDEATNSLLGRAKIESIVSGAPMRIGPIRYGDYPRMSGYTFLVGLLGKLTNAPEFASRNLSGLCGVVFAVLVLLVAKRQLTSRLAVGLVVASFLTSRIALIEFRYGFNCDLLAVSLMAAYTFSLLLVSEPTASFKKRVAWVAGASLATFLTLLNELLTGAIAYVLLLAFVASLCGRTLRRDRKQLVFLAIPAVLLLLALAIMLSNPLFIEELRRILAIRIPGNTATMPFYWDLLWVLTSSAFLNTERVFLALVLVSMVFTVVSLTRRIGHLLAYAPLLAPFIFITEVIRDPHFMIRTFSAYFPVFFASLIYALAGLQGRHLWRRVGERRVSVAVGVLLGLALLVVGFDRVRGVHAQLTIPHKYFNDIPFDESFAELVSKLDVSVPRDQVVLLPPHLLPFVRHPYRTDYFLSQLCAGKHHARIATDDLLLTRLLYRCTLNDVNVAVLHPVFFAYEAGIWPEGPAFFKRVLQTWEPLAKVGDFRIYRNPGPSASRAVLTDPESIKIQ